MSNTKSFTSIVLAVCLLPLIFNLLGIHFETEDIGFAKAFNTIPNLTDPKSAKLITEAVFTTRVISGSFIHTILEWMAFSVALFIVTFTFIQFSMKKDPITPIIGVALFCAGLMDAFHVMASDRLISAVAPNAMFVPFTWIISRLANALILFTGVLLLLSRKDVDKGYGLKYVLIISGVLVSLVLLFVAATVLAPSLPVTAFPKDLVPRPYDLIPMLIFAISGLWLFPALNHRHPSIFAQTLILSMIPQVAAQLYMAFGSRALFDNHFNIAHFLKVVAYLVPLIGLAQEYLQTFFDDELSKARLEEAQIKLQTANIKLEEKIVAVEERTIKLDRLNAEMLDDLKQGGVVQRGLMEVVATNDYSVDVVNHPYKGWVGGDGYSLLKANNGDYWLRVSDGTGHGSSGGEAEIVDHLLFATVINQAQDSAEAMRLLTTTLHERFPNANLTYAYFLAHLTATGHVDYVNARQLAFHVKKHHVEQLPSIPVIVGEIGDIEITNCRYLVLEPDESLLIATDGIFEALYWKEHRQKKALVGKRAIKARVHLPTQELYKEITSFPKFKQSDDILIVKLTKEDTELPLHLSRLMREMTNEELASLQNSEITSQSWRKTHRDFQPTENNNTETYYFADLGTETRDFLRKLLEYNEASKRLVRQTQAVINELLLNAENHMAKPSYVCFTVSYRSDSSILVILVNSSSKENFEKAKHYVSEALDAKAAGKAKLDELADKLLEKTSGGGMGLWNAVTQARGDFWVTFDPTENHLTSYCIIREK